jgi:hypothetical protein
MTARGRYWTLSYPSTSYRIGSTLIGFLDYAVGVIRVT